MKWKETKLHLSLLRYIEDITSPSVDMNFTFECSTPYLTNERQRTSETSSWTQEGKIPIHKQACDILFII